MNPHIKMTELCSSEHWAKASFEVQANLLMLYYKVYSLREHSCLPLIMRTDDHPYRGFRSDEDQIKLYQTRGGKPPMHSLHLIGAAVDIFDPDQRLQHWILDHLSWSEMNDVYYESFDATHNWVHLQLYPTLSGRRFFSP